MLYRLARNDFQGHGAIVDAGSFLGRSAYCLAQGLRANPRVAVGRDRVHCFDNFLVNDDFTLEFLRNRLHLAVAIGDSTRTVFESEVRTVRDQLEVHAGDFHVATWPDRPVEILLVDIAKTIALGGRVVEIFFPRLIPGRSLVVQQDYHHPWLPHIHVVMEYLADYFELVVPRLDDSAVFRSRDTIPAAMLKRAMAYDFTPVEELQLMDRAVARLPPTGRTLVELARIVLQGRNRVDTLRPDFERVSAEASLRTRFGRAFRDIRAYVDEQDGWRQKDLGNYGACLRLADAAIARGRRNTHTLGLRGCALNGLGRVSEAELALRAAWRCSRDRVRLVELARALKNQHRLSEAVAELVRGLRDRDATEVPARHYVELLEAVWQRQNDADQEVNAMRVLLAERPHDPEMWALDARVQRRQEISRPRRRVAQSRGECMPSDRLREIRHHEAAAASLRRAADNGMPSDRVREIRLDLGDSEP